MTLPWVQPGSPGLFFFPLFFHGIAFQSNELSRVVSAARAPCGEGGRGLHRLEISHRRLHWGQTCCKFYKKNTLQTRSPTLVRTELLINNLETTGADPTFPEPPGSQSALERVGGLQKLQLRDSGDSSSHSQLSHRKSQSSQALLEMQFNIIQSPGMSREPQDAEGVSCDVSSLRLLWHLLGFAAIPKSQPEHHQHPRAGEGHWE